MKRIVIYLAALIIGSFVLMSCPGDKLKDPPVASFTCDKTSGNAPLTVNFTSNSTGVITSYSWTFGDAGTSTNQHPSHTFTNSGTYTVALIVTGPDGSNSNNKTITVTQAQTFALTTTAVTSITSTSAVSGGNILADGGAAITSRGVCWSTSVNPTISLTTKTSDGIGTGIFISNITGLSGNTTYHLQAYATNSIGTVYGNDISFTTTVALTLPNAPSNLTATPISSTEINLSWIDNSNNEDGFKVERAPGGTTNFSEIISLPANTTSYQNSGLSGSAGYNYRIRAYNSGGNSGYSNIATANPYSNLPNSPSISSPSTSTGSFTVTLSYSSWPTLINPSDGYELEESAVSSTSGFARVSIDFSHASTYNVQFTKASGTYYYRARVSVGGIYSLYSNVVMVIVTVQNKTFNPDFDNLLVYVSNIPADANTVYSNNYLAVGSIYTIGLVTSDYLTAESTLYFNINTFITGKTIKKAILRLYVQDLPADLGTTYSISPLSKSWSTSTITFANCPNYYNTYSVIKSPPTTSVIPWEVDITSIVQAWSSGLITNYGILLRDNNLAWPSISLVRTTDFYSLETAPAGKKPELYIELQ